MPEYAVQSPEQVALDLYTSEEYFHQLGKDISETTSGDRIAITTMSFEPGEPLVENLVGQLEAAADRGANVTLAVDAFAQLADGSTKVLVGPLWAPLPFGQAGFRNRTEVMNRLDANENFDCKLINTPDKHFTNPYAGRSHLKINVVNDKVYIGGPNLLGTERIDMVVGWEDKESADLLYKMTTDIAATGNTAEALGTKDQVYVVNDSTQILLDAGRPNQSLILETAFNLIDEAQEKITISGQFFPHGRTADHLKQAYERGVDVTAIHNHPSSHTALNGLWQRMVLKRERDRLPAELFDAQLPRQSATMHSAILATEQAVLKGGHNLVDTGVKFGTPEIAVLQRNPALAQAAAKLLAQQVEFIKTPNPESSVFLPDSDLSTPLFAEY